MLTSIIIIALVATTVLFALIKNGLRVCNFCAGFWICVLLSIVWGYLFGFSHEILIYPFASGAITGVLNKYLWT